MLFAQPPYYAREGEQLALLNTLSKHFFKVKIKLQCLFARFDLQAGIGDS